MKKGGTTSLRQDSFVLQMHQSMIVSIPAIFVDARFGKRRENYVNGSRMGRLSPTLVSRHER